MMGIEETVAAPEELHQKTLTIKDLLHGTFTDDVEDDDQEFQMQEDVDANDEDEDDDDDEDEDGAEEDEEVEVDKDEVQDLMREAMSLQTGKTLRSGAKLMNFRDTILADMHDEEDDADADYNEEHGDEEDEEEEDDDDEDDEEDEEEVPLDEVKDLVVNAAPIALPSKDSTILRDGKEIPGDSVLDLTSRFNELMQE